MGQYLNFNKKGLFAPVPPVLVPLVQGQPLILFLKISNEKILLEYQKSGTQVYRKYTLGTRTIKNTNHKHPSKKKSKT